MAGRRTRLETRTKECDLRARSRASTPDLRSESNFFGVHRLRGPLRARSLKRPSPARQGEALAFPSLRSSARVATRKPASYACVGRSQGKLWWRPEAVLTCKSIVKREHRGERPIELASSWFPPKYPPGQLAQSLVASSRDNDWRSRGRNGLGRLSNSEWVRSSVVLTDRAGL